MENLLYILIITILILIILIYLIISIKSIVVLNEELLKKLSSIIEMNSEKSDLILKKLDDTSKILANWCKESASLIVQMKDSNRSVVQDLNLNLHSQIDKINKTVSELDKNLSNHIKELSSTLKNKLENNNNIINQGLVNIDKTLKETINI